MHDGLLIKGGGHAMAAGVTLRKERLAEFRAYMESALEDSVAKSRNVDDLFVDGAVTARALTSTSSGRWSAPGPMAAAIRSR